MAHNPYQPGVGTTPPYLADRDEQLQRFGSYLRDFPDKRRNVRLSGLRGVGKTVLLKEYRAAARERDWVVIRRDLTARLCHEEDFAIAIADDLDTAIRAFSTTARLKGMLAAARAAVGEITVGLPGGVSVSMSSSGLTGSSILEDRLARALIRVGQLAAKAGRGVAFLYDEAHTLFDRPRQRQYPLSALLGAFVQAQDEDDPPLSVMLVVSGLPPLVQNLQAARSHTERLFRVEDLGHLALTAERRDEPAPAALALIKPALKTGIRFERAVAEQVATDVDGYPYFIQKYGEALWMQPMLRTSMPSAPSCMPAHEYAFRMHSTASSSRTAIWTRLVLTSSRCVLPPRSGTSDSRLRRSRRSSGVATRTPYSRV
jgi:AAA ATPase-like protein